MSYSSAQMLKSGKPPSNVLSDIPLLDVRLGDIKVRFPNAFDEHSLYKARGKFKSKGQRTEPFTRIEDRPLGPHVPSRATLPLPMGMIANNSDMDDARSLVLCDFGESFAPATVTRQGNNAPLDFARGNLRALRSGLLPREDWESTPPLIGVIREEY